jgi:hypothetical protein
MYPYQTGSGSQEVKQTDFDGRIDVIPVSDPNIFSQSQRITMAQELMALVQSNPEIHGPGGVYEAYRRMYAALGVDNVDSLLQPPAPPPPPPAPIDAGIENSGFMMIQPQQAFEPQNHQAHVDAHRSLFLTEVVKTTPQLQSLIIAHCMQHLQFMSTLMAKEQMPPQIQQQIQQLEQQMAQVPPEQQPQVVSQIQMITESFSSPIMAQLTQDFLMSIGQGNEEDPLVQIRKKELDLREQELNAEQGQFDEKQAQRGEEKLLDSRIAKQRIGTQKQIADDKLDMAVRRLEQQAELKLRELQAKFGGIR